jgi:two-component system, OmpR family, phosphate regulon sensor histidine kinase PhoR
MKHLLFKKVLFIYLIIALLLLGSLELYLSREIKDSYILNLRENLVLQARLIAGQMPASFQNNLDGFCKSFKTLTGARVTIIDGSGKVLGDSDESSEKMENHANRPEIKDAELSDTGSSIRFSKTIRKNLLYVAIAVKKDSDAGKIFLRLSLPLHDVETAVNKIRIRIILASLSVLFLVMLLGLLQTRKITKSLEDIADFSKEVTKGHFPKRLFFKERNELGELGNNISDMAQEMSARLKQSDEEKQKMEAVLRNMSDGLILTGIKGEIILSNEAVSKLFGISSGIEGKTLMETLRKAELTEFIEQVKASSKKISGEITLAYPRDMYLMVTASPFYSDKAQGELSGIVFTFHDITRLRKLEEIRKDFVANVSHEIKTPITAIKGFAETLLEGALDDREHAYKFLETIKNNSERLNSLVNDLLTLSRIELGDIKIEKTDVNLNEIIDTVFATLRNKAENKGLSLTQQIAPGITGFKADRDRLIQILLNLVDNGIKFTEKGGVAIKVESETVKTENEGGKDFIRISVEDTGTGIPRKHLSRLGERFYRVDRARSRELGGTGLGLAIVKHIVKAHGWEMKIESDEGKGTAVHILCPLA